MTKVNECDRKVTRSTLLWSKVTWKYDDPGLTFVTLLFYCFSLANQARVIAHVVMRARGTDITITIVEIYYSYCRNWVWAIQYLLSIWFKYYLYEPCYTMFIALLSRLINIEIREQAFNITIIRHIVIFVTFVSFWRILLSTRKSENETKIATHSFSFLHFAWRCKVAFI